MRSFDVIVVGCGAMGSSITYHLAKSGLKTLNLERFELNHANGSSHGRTRIIRTAYSENPFYVPLVRRALELWKELERESKKKLLELTGGLMIGEPEGELVKGILKSAKRYGLPHEVLRGREISDKFKALKVSDEQVSVYENLAGVLFAEDCIRAHVSLAEREGGEFHFQEPLLNWRAHDGGVIVKTSNGQHTANNIVFASGPWMQDLLDDVRLPLTTERQVVFWFEPKNKKELFLPPSLPIFAFELSDSSVFYGIPDFGDGLKAARHHQGEIVSPNRVNRTVTHKDELPVRKFLAKYVPFANGPILSYTTCMYTNAPDGHFIIDRHPRRESAIIVSACSGHGFKFSPVIGEIVLQLIKNGKTEHNISRFSIGRFSKASTRQ